MCVTTSKGNDGDCLMTVKKFPFLEAPRWLRVWPLVLPLLFFAAMFLFFPFRERFEFNTDEGLEGMKALLLARGHPLYTETWSDQPPLFTYILAVGIRFFGTDINAARVLVLLFSTALLAVAVLVLGRTWGGWHALAGVLLIFLLPYYTTLSVSVMVAVPVMTFAMLSLLALMAWHERRQDRWLFLSALALSLSILTKLFIAFLTPVFVLGLLLDERARLGKTHPWTKILRPALLWSLSFAFIILISGVVLVGSTGMRQLLSLPMSASANEAYLDLVHSKPVTYYLADSWPIFFLAVMGCHFVAFGRRWISFYLLAWAVFAFIMLTFYAPVWFHHQLLITIPAAMLAGIAVGEALRLLPKIVRTRPFLYWYAILTVFTLAGLVFTLVERLPVTLPDFERPPVFITKAAHAPWFEQMFLTKMTNHAPQTHWVVTTLTTYAFRTGLPVPPVLAVPSFKRIANGELTEEQIITIVDEYKPEQVLIRENEFPLLEKHLEAGYRLLLDDREKLLYLRNDLKGQ
jgi:4-amino-4-deoxy-L-arabinose transferase-like glycosyltransferase